ncbi:MAG: electron transport complex subunit E [Spirochaetales bacterium]|nr:electron transport complex subunit E [Spirochaetales bacterium]
MKELTKGIYRENPIFVLVLGLCPSLAVTTQVVNGIGMGVGTMFVLICSNVMISLLKNVIPDEIHIPAYIVVIASFVTILDLVMQAYIPALSASLGVFVQLIVVNCVILGRAEAFASSHGVWDSIKDAIGMGIGFTLSLVLIAFIRESLGAGTITLFPVEAWNFSGEIRIPGLANAPARVMTLSAGALLVMGYLKGLINAVNERKGQ